MPEFTASLGVLFRDRFSSGLRGAVRDIERASRSMESSADQVGNSWRRIDLASDLAEVGAQVGDLARKFERAADGPAKYAASVEAAMGRVRTVLSADEIGSGATGQIADAARATALGRTAAGQIVGVTEQDFLAAVYTGKSSSLSVEESIALADRSAILAQAGGASHDTAAVALATTYTQFGDKDADKAGEMARLSGVLAATQQKYAFEDLQQFTDGLKNAAGAALGFGVPLEDLSAMVGVLNSLGITGPEAGTAMKTAITMIGPAAEQLGIELVRTSSGAVDMVGSIKRIAEAGVPAQALADAFGGDAGPAVTLLAQNLGLLEDGLGPIRDSMGADETAAREIADTYDASVERLTAAWGVMKGELGEGTLGVRQLGVDLAATGVQILAWATELPVVGEGLTQAAGAALQWGASLAGVAAGGLELSTGLLSTFTLLDPGGPMMKMAKGGISALVGGFGGLAGGAVRMGRGLLAAVPAIGVWTASMWSAAAAHIAAAWPIYAVIGAVAALAGVVYLVVRNWEPIVEWFRDLWASIVGIFKGAWDAIAGEGTLLGKLFGAVGSGADDADQLGAAVDTALDEQVTPRMPSSDAERGPLSRLTAAGRAIPETLAAGIAEEAGAIGAAIGAATDVQPPLDSAVQSLFAAGGAAAETALDAPGLTAAGRAIPETLAAGIAEEAGAIDAAISAATDVQLAAPLDSAVQPPQPPDAARTAGRLGDARLIEALERLTEALRSAAAGGGGRGRVPDLEAAVEMQDLIGGVGWEAGIAGA